MISFTENEARQHTKIHPHNGKVKLNAILITCDDVATPREYVEYYKLFNDDPTKDHISSEVLQSLEKCQLIRFRNGKLPQLHKIDSWEWEQHPQPQLFRQFLVKLETSVFPLSPKVLIYQCYKLYTSALQSLFNPVADITLSK